MIPKSFPAALVALPLALGAILSCDTDRLNAVGETDQDPQQKSFRKPDVIGAPELTMRISGFLMGRLTPCGCASGQLGGLPRRVFNLKADRNHELLIEGGRIIDGSHGVTELDLEKMSTALQVLSESKYHALGISPKDLELPLEDLTTYLGGYEVPVVCSDLRLNQQFKGKVEWPGKAFVERKAKSVTARIAALTLALPKGDASKYFTVVPPQKAWSDAMAGVDPKHYRLLLVHGNRRQAAKMTALTPRPDLVICIGNDYAEPPGSEDYENGVPVVFPGIRGRMLLDVTLARGKDGPALTRYRVIYLRGSKTVKGAMEDKTANQVVLAHRDTVKELGLREKLARRLPTTNGAEYVGSSACKKCHEEDYELWQGTTHAEAWETLEKAEVKKYKWPVTHYPDCVYCHTVGYYQKTGFINPDKTPDLKGVGCEQCHGAGSQHVKDPEKVKLGKVSATSCTTCHDFEQSPDFDYTDRWQLIEHGRKANKPK